ncbi:MAG: lecithin retinol acyltransferase family protein [Rhodoferax sp.]
MPYQHLADGLYLVKQKSASKGVDHYGILDVGNRLCHPEVNGLQPVVLHQSPPSIRLNWLQDTGTWEVMGKITNERDAIARIEEASRSPAYNLFGHNCEHFARYVATGKRESTQIQAAAVVAGLVALVYVAG